MTLNPLVLVLSIISFGDRLSLPVPEPHQLRHGADQHLEGGGCTPLFRALTILNRVSVLWQFLKTGILLAAAKEALLLVTLE